MLMLEGWQPNNILKCCVSCKEGVMAEKREKDTHLFANLIQNIVKFCFFFT